MKDMHEEKFLKSDIRENKRYVSKMVLKYLPAMNSLKNSGS